MSVSAIESTLQQMASLATQAAGPSAGKSADEQPLKGTEPGSFSGELKAAVGRINELQQSAGNTAMAFQTGDPGVALHEVMVDMQKASVAFQMGVQVRNRLVSAYKDVMNMPV
ncbi:flagellar hook-basal body complex protein FliE [Oceanisphaera arctica]|uniref:Flagellar hook-basal body complex protein FliE n=1 Tax=Oceanisphaera arctica TaxID=641510 RepID=A0A2P5TMM9_9GAMM|nr:flagellar hook-basal body complex protein FliE [Oceanisphaera arctica]PPL16744.1 flagellar hook-basal body complex protein FliE [Oceanisphaera arctica]GHA06146.1 flagellar hook-basal body complex protein FliE [Oceanisphaera arctica]